MKIKPNILVVCAMGYSTSSLIKLQIRIALESHDIDANLESVSVNNLVNHLANGDLIITSLDLNPDDYQIPVINAMELISGRDKDKVVEKILEAIERLN
jgi:galactitol-specific phosphotransferase system IIB component